jgi:hypothetical protein
MSGCATAGFLGLRKIFDGRARRQTVLALRANHALIQCSGLASFGTAAMAIAGIE